MGIRQVMAGLGEAVAAAVWFTSREPRFAEVGRVREKCDGSALRGIGDSERNGGGGGDGVVSEERESRAEMSKNCEL